MSRSLRALPQEPETVDLFRNLVMLVRACQAAEVDPAVVMRQLPADAPSISLSTLRTGTMWEISKQIGGHTVTVSEYNRMALAMIAMLGHLDHFRKAGRVANQVSFGFEALQKWGARTRVGRLLLSPFMLYRELPKGSLAWNTNKEWKVTRMNGSSVMLWCKYQRGVNILDDLYSLYYLIPGMNEEFPRLVLDHGAPLAAVESLLVAAPVDAVLDRLEPLESSRYHWKGDDLYRNDRFIGMRVWVKRDEHGQHSGMEWSDKNEEDTIVGVRIVEDICTRCTRTGAPLPLLRQNTIFQLPSSSSAVGKANQYRIRWTHSTIFVRWRKCLADAAFQFMGPRFLTRGFTAEIEAEMELERQRRAAAEAAVKAIGLERIIGLFQAAVQQFFPNLDTAMRVIKSGNLTSRSRTLAVPAFAIFMDIVGSEKLASQFHDDVHWLEQKQEFIDELTQVARQHGLWVYQFLGDGFVLVGTSGFGDIGDRKTSEMGDREILLTLILPAIRVIRELAFKKLHAQLRVGINYGEMPWIAHRLRFRIDSAGEVIRDAARVEGGIAAGTVACTDTVVSLLDVHTIATLFGEPRAVSVKHGRRIPVRYVQAIELGDAVPFPEEAAPRTGPELVVRRQTPPAQAE